MTTNYETASLLAEVARLRSDCREAGDAINALAERLASADALHVLDQPHILRVLENLAAAVDGSAKPHPEEGSLVLVARQSPTPRSNPALWILWTIFTVGLASVVLQFFVGVSAPYYAFLGGAALAIVLSIFFIEVHRSFS